MELTDEEKNWLLERASSIHDVGACTEWIIKFRRELAAKDAEIEELKRKLQNGLNTAKRFLTDIEKVEEAKRLLSVSLYNGTNKGLSELKRIVESTPDINPEPPAEEGG